MGEAYIVRRGGGSALTKSVIIVTSTPGNTVTCTKGTTVKKAKEINGVWVFGGLDIGTWTVTSDNGIASASKTVTFTEDGQSELVLNLNPILVIFDASAGGDQTVVTGGWTAPTYTGISENSVYASGNAYAGGGTNTTKNAIDITPFKTLVARGKVSGGGVNLKGSWGLTGAATQAVNYTNKEFSIDVSAINKPCTIFLQGNGTWLNEEPAIVTVSFNYIALLV